MKYAYPQDPTHAVSAIRRLDESSDSSTQQSNLERQQDIAVVGETVPLIFCRRFDWGGKLGVNGGVWMSPRLIQLGIEQAELSMMYLLSQGKITGLKSNNTYWGYNKLKSVDSSATMCSAYQKVPACLDLDYDPGGSLSWKTTVTANGPSGGGSITTPANVIKAVITFTSTIRITGTATISGWNNWVVMSGTDNVGAGIEDAGDKWRPADEDSCPSQAYWLWKTGGLQVGSTGPNPGWGGWYGGYDNPKYSGAKNWWPTPNSSSVKDFGELHGSRPFEVTSRVRYTWKAIDTETEKVVKEGQIWIYDGTTTLTIDGLPAGSYTISLEDVYADRDSFNAGYVIPTPGNFCQLYNYWVGALRAKQAKYDGYYESPPAGSETRQITSKAVLTVYNQLDFPDVPGGGQQLVGGLSDLTMLGINGDILKLRPLDGPDYFLQAHIFVENGIAVQRLTLGGTGPSNYYGDLVNHLMRKSQILQPSQIDVNSLKTVNRMADVYKMYFNGVLQTTNSLAEWMTRTAPYFLCTPRQVDGKYGLWPVCPLNGSNQLSRGKTVPVLTVGVNDITAGSYKREYITPGDRRPVCLVMVYRDQPTGNVGQTVTVEVRYPGTALSGPWESHDLTEFCCRSEQAIYAARYILAKRRYTTHTVSFEMSRRAAQLKPGDVIKVSLSGINTTEGECITGSVFYQIDSLAEGQAGSVAIEATHYPTARLNGVNDVSVVAYETHQGSVDVS